MLPGLVNTTVKSPTITATLAQMTDSSSGMFATIFMRLIMQLDGRNSTEERSVQRKHIFYKTSGRVGKNR